MVSPSHGNRLCFPSLSVLFSFALAAHCRLLVPQPGIEPRPLTVKARSPNHWTTRGIPIPTSLTQKCSVENFVCIVSTDSHDGPVSGDSCYPFIL